MAVLQHLCMIVLCIVIPTTLTTAYDIPKDHERKLVSKPEMEGRIDSFVEAAMGCTDFPGLTLGVVRGGEVNVKCFNIYD